MDTVDSQLTNNVLDYDLDRPQGHVTTGNLVCSPRSPFIRRYGLKEVFYGRK